MRGKCGSLCESSLPPLDAATASAEPIQRLQQAVKMFREPERRVVARVCPRVCRCERASRADDVNGLHRRTRALRAARPMASCPLRTRPLCALCPQCIPNGLSCRIPRDRVSCALLTRLHFLETVCNGGCGIRKNLLYRPLVFFFFLDRRAMRTGVAVVLCLNLEIASSPFFPENLSSARKA